MRDGAVAWSVEQDTPCEARTFLFSATLYRADGTVRDLFEGDPVPDLDIGDRLICSWRPLPIPLWSRPRVLVICAVIGIVLWALVVAAARRMN